MKYRIVKNKGRFIPQYAKRVDANETQWTEIKKKEYDPREGGYYFVETNFVSGEACERFIQKWHQENEVGETIVKEFEL